MNLDQAANLRQKMVMNNNPKKAKTIAIISGKGGVGKSNFAINFSLELLNQNKKVLLFDLDVGMGNIDILLGLQADQTIADMLISKLSIYDIIETGPRNLSYIAGGSALTQFFTMDKQTIDFFFKQYESLIGQYDYIIFDMGAGVTTDSMQFILAADECITITTPEPTAITDAYSMIKHVYAKKQGMPIYMVMNRASSIQKGIKAMKHFQQILKHFLTINVKALGVLPDDKIVQQAVIQQTPYCLMKRKSAIQKAMKILVSTYLQKPSANKQTRQHGSFIQKLKQFMIEGKS